MIRYYIVTIVCLFIFLSGCSDEGSAGNDTDYEATRKMVMDILQTDDGKKAIKEIITSDEMKQQLIMESAVIKESISEAFTSGKGTEMWSKLFEDPSFVESFSKSIADDQKKLIKSLMHDAEFQKQVIEILQNPEMMDQTLKVIKGQQFRSHLEETIEQTLENPLFQAKIQQLLLKAADKEQKSKEDKKAEDSDK